MVKHRSLFIFLIVIVMIFTSQAWSQEWSAEISVELPGQAMTTTPDFDIDPVTGHLHIVTMIDPSGVLYTEMDNVGNIIQQTQIALASEDVASGGGYFGATISVDPEGRPHVVYRHLDRSTTKEFSSYYTYWNGINWTAPVTLAERVVRGYMLRIDVDDNGRAHVARSSASEDPNDPTGNLLVGPVKYFRLTNGSKDIIKDDITRYSADDRLEIDASYENQVHLILSCSDYQPPGPIWYWRSFNGGEEWFSSEIRSPNATGQNGSSDLFVDASGKVHIVYGSEKDLSLGSLPSVRYTRFDGNSHLHDVVVNEAGEIPPRQHSPQGMGSVAASADGGIVMVAYAEGFGQKLWVRRSDNGGQSFGDKFEIAPISIGSEGKNKHLIRAYKSNFYIVYPSPTGVRMRYLKLSVNELPVANAGGPYQTNEGTAITFNASGSYDSDGSIVQYEWDFQNDGVYDQTSANATANYTFNDDFNGTVKLRVTDNEYETSTATQTVVVSNVPPTAEAGGPYSGEQNSPIQLTGSSTDPGNDTPIYSWDLDDDGLFETQGQSPQVTFSTGGTHVVTLKVTDGDGGEDTDEANVVISNESPVVSQIPGQTINEGESFTNIPLDNYVTDPDNPDNQISWVANGASNLQVTITNRVATITPKDAEWNGSETLTFVATDPGGLSDDSQATFTVQAVNDEPIVSQIPDQTIQEGAVFNSISLDNYVTDADNADSEITWTATGQSQLTVTITNRVATIQTPNADWFGSETVTFKATDPGGKFDSKSAVFTVTAVNDAPVVTQIPNQTINQGTPFETISLNDYVSDPDNSDSEITWTHNATVLNVQINNSTKVATITVPSGSWSGSETITFTARDPLGATGQSTATFTVGDFNEPPVVVQINDQTINENGTFSAIYLDYHVNDADNNDSEITWSWRGNSSLLFQDNQHILTVAVPDSEWAGTEIVTFIASDPGGKKDSCVTIFKVIPINDAPQLKTISDFYFSEDDTLRVRRSELLALVSDIDSPTESLQFQFTNMLNTHYYIDPSTNDLMLYAEPDWYGSESALFQVIDDKGGADFQTVNLIVQSSPDNPKSFALISPIGLPFEENPDSIQFRWNRSIDPDPGETTTYQWSLSQDVLFSHVMDQYNNLTDSVFVFRPNSLANDTYYWRVIAYDPTGRFTQCSNVGVFSVGTASVARLDGQQPNEYALLPNYPNPFNPETRITFQIPKNCHVRLSIYNSLGQLIKALFEGELAGGSYTKIWHAMDQQGKQVTSGVYIYKLETEEFSQVRKMLYIR